MALYKFTYLLTYFSTAFVLLVALLDSA